jgi:hypothetical protein
MGKPRTDSVMTTGLGVAVGDDDWLAGVGIDGPATAYGVAGVAR